MLTDPAFRAEPRQIAAALSQCKIPFSFHTSAYFGRRSLTFRFAERLPWPLQRRIEELLMRRYESLIDEGAVNCWIVPDVVRRVGRRLRLPDYTVNTFVERWFDRAVSRSIPRDGAAVIAMQGSALRTFRRARERGLRTVLIANTPDPAVEERIIRDEERRLGISGRNQNIRVLERLAARIRKELAEADLVLANSDYTRTDLVAHGVPPDKVVTVPLGVDLTKFSAAPLRHSRECARVLYVGGVHARKGVLYLAEAVEELRACGVNVQVRALGHVDPPYGRVLTRFVDSGALILPGHVSHHRLPEEYVRARIFAFPTLSDGFGLAVLEAMACGLPVIVSDRCGAPVLNRENGIITPAGEVAPLRAAIAELLEDQALASHLREGALATAQRSSWADYRARVVQELSRVVDGVAAASCDAPRGASACI